MNFDAFCRALRLNEAEAERIYPGFDASAREFAAAKGQETLTPEYLDMVLPWIGFEKADEIALRSLAERIQNDPVAALLFFHAQRTLFEGEELKAICSWPDFRAYLGAEHQLFYLLLSCAVFAPTLRNYRRAGLPEHPVRSIGRKIFGSNWINVQAFGVPGYDRGALYWLRHYVDLKVIPVGRFEFRHGKAATYGVEVYRRRKDGVLMTLFGPAPCGFRSDGSACPADDPEAVTTGGVIRTGSCVIGHALAPDTGYSMGVVKLPLDEWEAIITASTPVLEWHIPGGGGMTPEITRASLEEGLEFFDRHFPALPSPVAVMCSSWAFWSDPAGSAGYQGYTPFHSVSHSFFSFFEQGCVVPFIFYMAIFSRSSHDCTFSRVLEPSIFRINPVRTVPGPNSIKVSAPAAESVFTQSIHWTLPAT